MIDVLKEVEAVPNDYPKEGSQVAWERIEAYIKRRWPEREVIWTVRGSGLFVPRLYPATLTKLEIWKDAWQEVTTIKPSPEGVWLDGGLYRATFNVGNDGDDIPESVTEAAKRLAEYLEQIPTDGLTSVTDGDYSHTRAATSNARALPYSGAADLLRPYR